MSRPKKPKPDKPQPDATNEAVEKPEPPEPPEPPPNRVVRDGTPVAVPNVPEYRRCPLCWGRDKGKGKAYHTKRVSPAVSTRYYRCDCCGHTWPQKVRKEVFPLDHCKIDVHHRTVEIEVREQ